MGRPGATNIAMAILNRTAQELLKEAAAELRQLAERWEPEPVEAEAVAATHVVLRITEAVHDAIRLRPEENPVSTLTMVNLDAIVLGLASASRAASSADLAASIGTVAERLRATLGTDTEH